jgi:hypothetical protein
MQFFSEYCPRGFREVEMVQFGEAIIIVFCGQVSGANVQARGGGQTAGKVDCRVGRLVDLVCAELFHY